MKADVRNILKEACQRSRRNKGLNTREEHFDMSDVDRVLEERKKMAVDFEAKHPSAVAIAAPSNEIKEKRIFKAASLSDIFGFNPQNKEQENEVNDSKNVPSQWKVYYDKLIQLKKRLQKMEEEVSEEEDSLLDLVSNPKETLEEIDAALKRIFDGTYGICEATGKPIAQQRLESIPYTRYSLEGQAQLEEAKRMRLLAQMANTQRISDSEDNDIGQQRPFYETDDDQDLGSELEE